jgi:hypothetical protein
VTTGGRCVAREEREGEESVRMSSFVFLLWSFGARQEIEDRVWVGESMSRVSEKKEISKYGRKRSANFVQFGVRYKTRRIAARRAQNAKQYGCCCSQPPCGESDK